MKEMESLILSVSPELIHDVGCKVLYGFLLLISLVILFVSIKLQVNHESKINNSTDYDVISKHFYVDGILIGVVGIVCSLIGLFP